MGIAKRLYARRHYGGDRYIDRRGKAVDKSLGKQPRCSWCLAGAEAGPLREDADGRHAHDDCRAEVARRRFEGNGGIDAIQTGDDPVRPRGHHQGDRRVRRPPGLGGGCGDGPVPRAPAERAGQVLGDGGGEAHGAGPDAAGPGLTRGPLPVPSDGRAHRIHDGCGGAGCPDCSMTGFASMGPAAIAALEARLAGEAPVLPDRSPIILNRPRSLAEADRPRREQLTLFD